MGGDPSSAIALITGTSFMLCLALNEVACFCAGFSGVWVLFCIVLKSTFKFFLMLFEVSLCFYYWHVTGFWNQISILISNTLRSSWFRFLCFGCLWFRCSWLLYRSKLVTNIETLLCLTLWRSQEASVLVQGSVNPTSKAIDGEQCSSAWRIVFWDVTLYANDEAA